MSFTLNLKHENDQFFFHSLALFVYFNFHLFSHQEVLFFLLANLCGCGLPEPCSKLLTVLGQENCMWNTDIWYSMQFEHWKVEERTSEENDPEEISSKSISLKSAFLSWCWLFQSRLWNNVGTAGETCTEYKWTVVVHCCLFAFVVFPLLQENFYSKFVIA